MKNRLKGLDISVVLFLIITLFSCSSCNQTEDGDGAEEAQAQDNSVPVPLR